MKSFLGYAVQQPQILTPNDGYHYFFGYYDLPATDLQGRHLCHRVSFMDRLPEPEDVAELGWVKDGVFTPFATTTAWNFQQGALLQFHGQKNDTVLYNSVQNGRFCTVTQDLATGEKRYTDRAAAAVSEDGKWGLGINFGRIFAFRPGYGYAGFVDENADVKAPGDDGVFLIDMESGSSRLLVSYAELASLSGFDPAKKILVNHINFSPDCDHYVMLLRDFPLPDQKGWSTTLVLGDTKGNCQAVLTNTMVSHYRWVNEQDLVAYCCIDGRHSMYLIHMKTGAYEELHTPYFCRKGIADIHCNAVHNGKYIIGDGYPVEGYRYMIAYNRETGASKTLFGAATVIPPVIDIRCDLHARFSADGKWITYDTTENGKRQMAAISTDVLQF
ncbi:MAG: hypothetical protein IJY50_07035 [Clostridia bacterium]|nr:hypothetical protein [Clostridia bacterium]